jgi:hypothetical protein
VVAQEPTLTRGLVVAQMEVVLADFPQAIHLRQVVVIQVPFFLQ